MDDRDDTLEWAREVLPASLEEEIGGKFGLEPPGRPGSAPPIIHSELDGFSFTPAFEAGPVPRAAYREPFDVPSRPRSAPADQDMLDILDDEAWRLDFKDKANLIPFQAPGVRSSSPLLGDGAELQRQRALLGMSAGMSAVRTLQAAAVEADRFTPPPTQVHPGLLQSPHSPFGSPGLGSGRLGYSDEPALLHPGAVRAFDPIHRPISAPPAPESGLEYQENYGDIRCDPLYQHFYQDQMNKGQNANLPKPLDPCQEILNHRANSTASEFGPSVSELTEQHTGTQKNLGFAPATGFSSYVPRSPSPPWDGAAISGMHSASSHGAGQDSQAPVQASSLPGLPLGSPGFDPYFEALRSHPPLLGTFAAAGVPASFPWNQVPMSMLPTSIPPIAEEVTEPNRRDEVVPLPAASGAMARARPGGPSRLAPPKATTRSVAPDPGVLGPALKAEPDDRKPARSAFKLSQLEEMFSNNTYMSSIYSIARDQAGCRMLQHKLDEGGPEVFNAVFKEVANHAVELMMDPFGNYLCQKLMDMASPRQLEAMVEKSYNSLVNISLNMHGARAVQKLIDVVRLVPACMRRLVAALDHSVVPLTKDPNGNHVVQRCLESLPSEAHIFIFRAVANDMEDVASHRHGCRIVQRCIDASMGSDRTMLIGAICHASLTLIQDPFGNYVVQYVLGLHDPQASTMIVNAMMGRLHVLSRQKFSSNVVERCLQLASGEDRARMINELADPRGLGELLRDVYGNYVVQSALNIAVEPQISFFLGAVRPLLPSLRASGQGRRIAQKLEKKFPQLRAERGGEGARQSFGAPQGHQACGAGAPTAQGGLDGPASYLVPGAVAPGILNAGFGAANIPGDGLPGNGASNQRKKGKRGAGAGRGMR